ncbi:chitinase [Saccharopolyspora lacisalsi]|uniref:chitinase n=1 Tax=Halosaccharopolyspora lacisalsi TaxID=1000566 RepID=A0A839DZ12_9PSEU|nr:chitinase [Halosaccharopolyspora lacisalsi]
MAAAAALLPAALSLSPVVAAAEPAPSAPSTTSRAALPDHQLTGYWQNFVNNAPPLRVSDIPSNYDLVALAFAQSDPTAAGAVTFGVDSGLSSALGGYTDADLKADIAAKQAAGTDFVLSIGGAKGSVDLSSASNVTRFVDSVSKIINDYGLDGVDIDIEHGLDVDGVTSAVRQLHQRFGDDFVLTMAPQTLHVQPGGSYLQLIKNVQDIITVVHTQYYNSGSMLGCNGNVHSQGSVDFITAQACILLRTLRPDQVSLGLPATPSAAGSGYVAPSVITSALDCLAAATRCGQYVPERPTPTISGVMTWSINWDVGSGNAFSDPIRAHLDSL